jgi:hypothetical protein
MKRGNSPRRTKTPVKSFSSTIPTTLKPFLAIDFADGGDNQMIVVLKNPVAKDPRHIVPWHG